MVYPLALLWNNVVWRIFWSYVVRPCGHNHFSASFNPFSIVWHSNAAISISLSLSHYLSHASRGHPSCVCIISKGSCQINCCIWRITPISVLWFPFMFYPSWSSTLRIQCYLYFFWLLNQAVTLGCCLPPSSMSPTELRCDFTRVIGQVGRRESGARFWAAHMFWHGWDLCVTFKQKKRANPSLGGLGHFCRLGEFTAVIQDFWAHQHNVLIPWVSISFLWNQGPDCGTADLP